MPLGDEEEIERVVTECPAGEGADGRVDVELGIEALAQGEQLEQLSAEILVRMLAAAGVVVQPDQHRAIFRNFCGEIREPAERMRANQLVLLQHQSCVFHFRDPCREVVVPEERQPLFEWARRMNQPREPPARDSLECSEIELLPFDALIELRSGDGRVIEEFRNGEVETVAHGAGDLLRRSAERGAAKKVRGIRLVPGDRRHGARFFRPFRLDTFRAAVVRPAVPVSPPMVCPTRWTVGKFYYGVGRGLPCRAWDDQ